MNSHIHIQHTRKGSFSTQHTKPGVMNSQIHMHNTAAHQKRLIFNTKGQVLMNSHVHIQHTQKKAHFSTHTKKIQQIWIHVSSGTQNTTQRHETKAFLTRQKQRKLTAKSSRTMPTWMGRITTQVTGHTWLGL
jgi:hypothetical protein